MVCAILLFTLSENTLFTEIGSNAPVTELWPVTMYYSLVVELFFVSGMWLHQNVSAQCKVLLSRAALHCICTFSLPVQMPHLAKVGVCWQAAHEGRTSYWILGSPPPLGESGIRYNLRVSENFCDPQYQGQEIKWNYVTLPTYAAKSKNTKKSAASQIPSRSHCDETLSIIC